MSCRTWPPFYEKEINGVCVSAPPKDTSTSLENWLGLFLIVAVITVPFYLASKSK